jgi:hypothetical protein
MSYDLGLRRDVGGGAGQARQAEIFNIDQGSLTGAAFHRPADQERHRDQHGRHGETTSSLSGCGAA